MTIKAVVLYTHPADPAAFDEHYLGVHMPLVATLPGMDHAETAKLIAAGDGGDHTFYRMAEIYYSDLDALAAGMGSPEGQAVNADFQAIAPSGSRIYIAQVD